MNEYSLSIIFLLYSTQHFVGKDFTSLQVNMNSIRRKTNRKIQVKMEEDCMSWTKELGNVILLNFLPATTNFQSLIWVARKRTPALRQTCLPHPFPSLNFLYLSWRSQSVGQDSPNKVEASMGG